MKQFGKIVLIVLGLSGFAAALSSVPSRPAAAASGAPVIVQNFPATQTVNGTVAAAQSGAWNVGIAGTPSVNATITGTPTVNANVTFPSSLNVANPATAPLFFVNLGEPGRIPYQSTLSASCSAVACSGSFPAVSSGRRLVIQHFGGSVVYPSPSSSSVTAILSVPGGGTAFYAPSNDGSVLFDQPVLVYVDAGEQPFVTVPNPSSSAALNGAFTLSGYLVDCNVASCAAIAP